MSDNEGDGQANSTSWRSKLWFAVLLLSSFLGPLSHCYSWDLAIEGDLVINGLASSPAVDGSSVDPSLNPPINWSFDWGDFSDPDAVTIPDGVGIGTDTEINVVDIGGAGAGGGGLDGALAYAMDASAANHLVFDARAYELAVKLTVHNDHVNVLDNGGAAGTQSGFRIILKDYDGIDSNMGLRAQEDLNYEFDITGVPKGQMVEFAMPLDTPSNIYHDPPNGVGDSIVNFDPDDPEGAGTGGAFELQVGVPWASHGRFHITLHEVIIREITATALAGDYNNDQVIDAADYVVWRNNLGTNFNLNGNGDESGGSAGIVDAADYAWWRQHFGNSNLGAGSTSLQGFASAVPEPHGLVLLVIGLFCSSLTRNTVTSARGPNTSPRNLSFGKQTRCMSHCGPVFAHPMSLYLIRESKSHHMSKAELFSTASPRRLVLCRRLDTVSQAGGLPRNLYCGRRASW
jgi:hypothetical protein